MTWLSDITAGMVGALLSARLVISWDLKKKFPAARNNMYAVRQTAGRSIIMAIKTAWQKRQEAAGKREFDRWDWLRGCGSRQVQARKALYLMGYKVNYPFRKR